MAIKPLNSVAGFSVGENPNVVILANGDITTTSITTTGVANLNEIANVKISGGTSGQVIQTDGSGTLSFVTIDTWRIQNGTSNVQVAPSNGNVTVSVAGNANIATFTSSGANISGYLTIEGTVTANGNISANNYLVTPASKDLIIAPATNLVRTDANVNPYNDATYSLGNNLARWANVYSKEANISGNANIGTVRTDNLLYANGQPWDLQEAAGSNTYVQYNDGSNNFGASANFTYDDSTQVLAVTGNVVVTDTANVGNLRTDNLLYANGQPWDLQEAAGSGTQIQYNDGSNNFGASANFTYNDATQAFYVNGTSSVTGNANVGNLGTAGVVTAAGNITGANLTTAGVVTATGNIDGGNLNTGGALSVTGNANVGNLGTTGLITATGNVIAGNVETAGSVVGDVVTANTVVNAGNLNVINNVTSSLIPDATNTYDLGNATTTWGNVYAANFVGNISGNIAAPGANTDIVFNDNGIANAVANFTYDKTFNSGGGLLNVGNTVNGQIITDNLYTAYANVNGNVDTSGNINASGNISGADITASGNISTTGAGGNLTMTGGDIVGVNNISANTANFSGNIVALNSTLGNLATANYVNVANDINIIGNVNAGNLVGPLANGTSNIKIYQDSNVEISIGGVANIATFSATGLYVDGEINTTEGNILSNGNVTANGFLNSANAIVTGEADLGSVKTATITAPVGNITISAAGTNENIILAPSGTGNVDVGLHNIIQLGAPVNPNDAATKEYVDSVAQGLTIHTPVRVEANAALTATYVQGGTTQTTTTITGGKTITFSTNHGLSVNDGIVWDNSFNGIVGGEAYWVFSVPALNQITVKDGYNGAEVTTLTNGTGLTQSSRANPGVGATLTNAGANAALVIDGITLANGDRVLVYNQVNAYENGVYAVTDIGSPTTAWVLTRSSDMDKYIPQSVNGMGYGDYFFIQEGVLAAGESYVMTAPQGEVIIGTDNISFTQFQAAGSYTAGSGINITGTVISANVDLVTTDIVGGNIVVKASANLTTPNVGDATFSSLTWNNLSNGNVTANNLSTANIANVGLDLTVGGLVQVNGNITSNSWVNANNAFITNDVSAAGNVIAANITANSTVSAANVEVSGTTVTDYLTVNNAITGNTADFSGNVVVPNISVNLELSGNTANFSGAVVADSLTVVNNLAGNTANFSGNVEALNANLGNLVTANYFTGTLANGTSNVAIPTANGNVNITSGGNLTLVVTDVGANIAGNLDVTGDFSVGALSATNVKADTALFVGNTTVTWANVTTTSVAANQTVSSFTLTGLGITGVEWLVKGVDSTGSKYSVATVQAVTDGTTVDYTTYGTVQLGGYTGSLAVNIVGSTIRLQVTPASSNSTVWTTQYRLI